MSTQPQPNTDSQQKQQFSSATLRFICKKMCIYELFEKYVHDPRRIKSTLYTAPSLLTAGLLIFLLRLPSRNMFQEHGELSQIFRNNIAKLAHSTSMPSQKTIEDLFLQLNPSDLNPILPDIFRQLLRSKFFQLHPEFKGNPERKKNKNEPDVSFSIAIDAQVTHTYHDHNQHPTASCPYCLKRTRDRSIWYIHMDVVLSVIGAGGFQMPLLFHRVRANHQWENISEEKLKQECELSSLSYLLERFRLEFPRLHVTLLLDSLYANATAMNLAQKYHCNYMIVRKDGSLSSLNSDIEGLKKLQHPLTRAYNDDLWRIEQTANLFSFFIHKNHTFDVIELEETCIKLPSKRFAKVTAKSYYCQWIINHTPLLPDTILDQSSPKKIFKAIKCGRKRWLQEDFFNTINNRGFNMPHDFSRAPHSQTIWRFLIMIGFTLCNLMELSYFGHISRKSTAVITWIADILAQLKYVLTEILWSVRLPKQLRFRPFDTS
jgi:hypothetical protein